MRDMKKSAQHCLDAELFGEEMVLTVIELLDTCEGIHERKKVRSASDL